MQIQKMFSSAIVLAGLTTAAVGFMPAPAFADSYGTDAAVGAAVGSVVAQLLFDSGRQQYYYVHRDRRVYVDDRYAHRYGYYHEHDRYWQDRRGWNDSRRAHWEADHRREDRYDGPRDHRY